MCVRVCVLLEQCLIAHTELGKANLGHEDGAGLYELSHKHPHSTHSQTLINLRIVILFKHIYDNNTVHSKYPSIKLEIFLKIITRHSCY